MSLAHLAGQPVVALGAEPGDDVLCSELYLRLSSGLRADLEGPAPTRRVRYCRVGDRLLTYLERADIVPGAVLVLSYDLHSAVYRPGPHLNAAHLKAPARRRRPGCVHFKVRDEWTVDAITMSESTLMLLV